MSDTPRTDAVWTEYWNEFPTPENTATTNQRIFFDMKLKQLERELNEAKRLARQACDERYEIEQQATYERSQRKHTT